MRGKYFLGVILIIIGTSLLINQFVDFDLVHYLFRLWPTMLIALGIYHIVRQPGSYFNSLALIILGTLLQLNIFGYLPGGFWSWIWAFLLVLIGFSIITNKGKRSRREINFMDETRINAIFSGSKMRIDSDHYTGGNIECIFGGVNIDLRNAKLSSEGAVLDASCIFGGVELRVPEHWNVEIKGTPIFGGIDYKGFNPETVDDSTPKLKINCFVIFGGIDIKN